MDKQWTIEQFCALASRVGTLVYHENEAHDCFCSENAVVTYHFQFSPKVLTFIENAVEQAIRDSQKVDRAIEIYKGDASES